MTFCLDLKGQNSTCVNFYFDCDVDTIDQSRVDNMAAIKVIKDGIGENTSINRVYLYSSSSPDGEDNYNIALAHRRLTSTIELITGENIAIPDSLVHATSADVAWDELYPLIKDSDIPFRSEVLDILNNGDGDIRAFRSGVPYRYMVKYIFPQLRKSSVTIIYNAPYPDRITATTDKPISPLQRASHCNLMETTRICTEPEVIEVKPLFALKTNLLFDLLTLINVEIEVPIRDRWSVTGELTFPWWVWDNHKADSRRNRIELINGVVEGRYWWGDRSEKSILTGWFSGLYAGCGLYDFEHKAKGYQGEFFVAAGLSGGYAHTINKSKTLRMEYSLGVGFLQTKYRYYHAEFCDNETWHAVECRRGKYNWIGPTRAKVSLSWLLNYKRLSKKY